MNRDVIATGRKYGCSILHGDLEKKSMINSIHYKVDRLQTKNSNTEEAIEKENLN